MSLDRNLINIIKGMNKYMSFPPLSMSHMFRGARVPRQLFGFKHVSPTLNENLWVGQI